MLIDWMTLALDGSLLPVETRNKLNAMQDVVQRVSGDGELLWYCPARESIRSDTHNFSWRLAGDLVLMGSPARMFDRLGDNVFGSVDLVQCFKSVIQFASGALGVGLPATPAIWKLTRVDITANYDLQSLSNVRQALNCLRHIEGGRYQVKTSAESVYWSPQSRTMSGKAYAKGPHMRYMCKRGKVHIAADDLDKLDRLLRLELRLGSHFFRRKGSKWFNLTCEDLQVVHRDYFAKFIGSVEVFKMQDIIETLNKIAPTPGQARAAAGTWSLIQVHGYEAVKDLLTKSTFFRHTALLKKAGLTHADMQARKVLPFRQRAITIDLDDPVHTWEDLYQRCA